MLEILNNEHQIRIGHTLERYIILLIAAEIFLTLASWESSNHLLNIVCNMIMLKRSVADAMSAFCVSSCEKQHSGLR